MISTRLIMEFICMEPKKKRASKKKKEQPVVNEINQIKLDATSRGEPYIGIISVDVDPKDVNRGSFDLDWNDKFVTNLVRAGYKIKPTDSDQEIVDRWFQTVCRNVALEMYEQEIADPDNRRDDVRVIRQRNLGDGRTEVS